KLAPSPEVHYMKLIWRRRWLILFCVLVFIALGAFQVQRTTPIYSSHATLKYEPSSLGVVDFGERSTVLYQRDEIRTAVHMVRSPAIAEAVLDELDDPVRNVPVNDSSPLEDARSAFKNMLSDIRQAIVS